MQRQRRKLTVEDRVAIELRRKDGWGVRAIARELGRSPSVISAELGREQVDLGQGLLHVRRRKNGLPSTHPLRGPEIRALRKLFRCEGCWTTWTHLRLRLRAQGAHDRGHLPQAGRSRRRGGPMGMPIHPHMLRHSTGFKLANDGQDTRAVQHYLGHRNIQHTVLYTHLAADRFNGFWDD